MKGRLEVRGFRLEENLGLRTRVAVSILRVEGYLASCSSDRFPLLHALVQSAGLGIQG